MTREEAMEIVKKLYNDSLFLQKDKEALETFIPELRESEDERTRKEIISALKFANDDGVYDKHIAYLEKQKERGSLTKEEEYTLQRIIEYLEDETCPPEWISLLHDIYCLPYEKQKEQKPAECLDKDKVYVIMNKLHDLAFSQLIPINSDEYKKIDEIAGDVRRLLDYPIEQKPAEWSEEDEKQIAQIERIVKNAGCVKMLQDKIHNWFKSLRPSWKPSEEEMDALKETISQDCTVCNGDRKWIKPNLESLYEQLKAL